VIGEETTQKIEVSQKKTLAEMERMAPEEIREMILSINKEEADRKWFGIRKYLMKSDEPISAEALQKKADLERRDAILNKKVTGLRNRLFPQKVRVAWFERNFTALIVKDFEWVHDGLIIDRYWGRAAEIGPDVSPIEIGIDKDARLGFLVDGDKGVAVVPRRDKDLWKLECTSELLWVVADAARMAATYATDYTIRSKIITGIVFLVIGFFLGLGF